MNNLLGRLTSTTSNLFNQILKSIKKNIKILKLNKYKCYQHFKQMP